MKSLIILSLLLFSFSFAKLNVVVSYPWIGHLVNIIGKERVNLTVLAKGNEDPHFIVPKPSYIASARRADLLIINGADLEIGFIPPILQQSNNPKIQPGREGFLDLSAYVQLIEKPERVSREMGDVHPEGNPHYHLDPHNIPLLARAIKDKLCELDKKECSYYEANFEGFLKEWNSKLKDWDRRMERAKGTKVVSYHKLHSYFLNRYSIRLVGTVEPLPGIPPNARHVESLINLIQREKVQLILQDVYHEKKTAQYTSSKTGARVVLAPHDVSALPEIKNLFDLFEYLVKEFER